MGVIARFGLVDSSGPTSNKDVRTSICTSTEQVGDLVYLYDKFDNTDIVRVADPTDYAKTKSIGIIISKSNDTTCNVQWRGETPSIFSGLEVGSIYFLGNSGQIVKIPPVPGVSQSVFVQQIGIASDYDKIYVKPSISLTKRIGD